MGLLPPMKGYTQQNLFARLVDEGFCAPVWSLCFHEGSVSTGTLTIGGVDERLADGNITYVQNTASIPVGPPVGKVWLYGVHVSQLKVGTAIVEVGYTAFLDSGTNILLLPTDLHHHVRNSMCADESLTRCTDLWNNVCMHLSQKEIDAYPTIKMELDGVTLEMHGTDYLLLGSPVATSSDQHCIGIRDGGKNSLGGFLIGDTTMRNYYVVHDIGHKLIGWGNVSKNMCGSLDLKQGALANGNPVTSATTLIITTPWSSAAALSFAFLLCISSFALVRKFARKSNDDVAD